MSQRKSLYRAIVPFYDCEYVSNDILDNDVPFLLEHLPKKSVRILELCSGTGRVAFPLAMAGHRVTGIEIDRGMVKVAERKAEFLGLTSENPRWIVGDITKKSVPGPFDWVILLFNTFFNFVTPAEQSNLLERARKSLKIGGKLWLDVFHPDLKLLADEHIQSIDETWFDVPELGATVCRYTELRRVSSVDQIQKVTFHYRWNDSEGISHERKIQFDMTWMWPRELRRLLETSGFKVQKIYGNYDGSAIHDESPRMIVLATRAR